MSDLTYIGRGSYWGNPYLSRDRISKYGYVESLGERHKVEVVNSKQDAIDQYKQLLWNRINNDPQLKERILKTFLYGSYRCPGCGINSENCHGKVLKDAAIWISSQETI